MPFTFAHPALVMPLAGLSHRYRSVTGLVMGSMVPDFEYFIRMKIHSSSSHTFLGVFEFDLPLGLLLTFLYHYAVRDPLLYHMPIFFKARFASFRNFSWFEYFIQHWGVVILSLLVGIASHLLWDSFTHRLGFFVQHFPVFKNGIDLLGITFPVYRVVQHVSTFVGFAVLILIIMRLKPDPEVMGHFYYFYWGGILACTLSLLGVWFLNRDGWRLVDLIVSSISFFLLSLIFVPWMGRIYKGVLHLFAK